MKILTIMILASLSLGCSAFGVIGDIKPVDAALTREKIPDSLKWDLSLFYDSWEAWEEDVLRSEATFEEIASYKGRLSEGPQVLLKVMKLSDEAQMLLWKSWGYAGKWRDIDTRDNFAQAKVGRLIQLWTRVIAKTSWIDPEILKIPLATTSSWIDNNPDLEPSRIYSALTDSDGERPVVKLSNGEEITVTPGVYGNVLNEFENPVDRRAVQEAWMEQFKDRENTFAAIYDGVVQQNWAVAQSRGYDSSIKMRLNYNNIPVEVVTSLVESARQGSSELQRYHKLRQKCLGLADYGWSDMFVPLLPD